MPTPKKAVLIGAGERGRIYASYALKHPDRLKIVAVAEPNRKKREAIAKEHGIKSACSFDTWEALKNSKITADGAIIATQDSMHVEPAVMAMEKGYHVLLEKPMALTEADCESLIVVSQKSGKTLSICHVLRYTNFFSRIKQIVEEGTIGDVISVLHAENVSYHHMAHSFVRGNWGNSLLSSPMILAKCCHDLDLIVWIAGGKPKRVSSFGGLHHFKKSKAPPGATERCTDGCPHRRHCRYDAVDTYLHGKHMKLGLAKTNAGLVTLLAKLMLRCPGIAGRVPGLSQYRYWNQWPTSTITDNQTVEGVMDVLKTGPYGRCVYHCDNDQVDHQETIIEFENGTTATLRMHGHAEMEGRTIRIDGSLGTIRGRFGGGGKLEVHLHATGEKIVHPVKTDLFGHAEGDYGIMKNFVDVLKGKATDTEAKEALLSHQLAFAAHRARLQKKVIEL